MSYSDLDQILGNIDDIVTGKVPIIVLAKPKERKLARKKEILLEIHPVFTLCLLAKCKDIHNCWDLREYKFLGLRKDYDECPRIQKIQRRTFKEYYPYRLIKHGKALADFSELDIAHLLLSVRSFLYNYPQHKLSTQMQELNKKLELCSELVALIGDLHRR